MSYPLACTLNKPARNLSSEIAAWQSQTNRVHAIGFDPTLYTDYAAVGADVGGLTIIGGVVKHGARQDGYIRQIIARVFSVGAVGQTIKFKVFRLNGTNYDFVSESETFTFPGTGNQTFNLAQPMACQPGDILGFYLNGAALDANRGKISTANGLLLRYVAGDITGTNVAFPSTLTRTLCIEGLTNPAYITFTGDSIEEGSGNAVVHWYSYLSITTSGPSGNPTAEIGNQLRGLIGNGAELEYQNHARDGWEYADIVASALTAIVATKARIVWIHCGTNDTNYDVPWATMQGHLDTIRAAISADQLLYIDEILPRSDNSNAHAADIRTNNANLAVWCASNNATVIPCWSTFGQLRVTTGFNDDLLAAYDVGDGLHLSQAGVDALAEIRSRYL